LRLLVRSGIQYLTEVSESVNMRNKHSEALVLPQLRTDPVASEAECVLNADPPESTFYSFGS